MSADQSKPPETIEEDGFWLTWKGLCLLLLAVFILWLAYGVSAYNIPDQLERSAQAGDMFGGITALFSGLAFAGLIFTLFVQKQELQYQRKELSYLVTETRETTHHLRDQATHLKTQSEFIERQIFESSFFQMLSSFNTFLNSITVDGTNPSKTGADGLKVILNILMNLFRQTNVRFEEDYIRFVDERFNDDLGPYFRQIDNILKFVKSSNIEDKHFYTNILRAQLSSSELTLIYLNSASENGIVKMAPLIKEFDLLKYFDEADVIQIKGNLIPFYEDWDIPKPWEDKG